MSAAPEDAEWVEVQLDAVFARYADEVVEATLPVLLLLMARDFGIDQLSPKIQDAIIEVLRGIGLAEDTTPDEIERMTTAFIAKRAVDDRLLQDVADVLSRHYAALDARATDDFKRLVDEPAERNAPKVGEPAPPNTQSGEELKRRGTGKIRS